LTEAGHSWEYLPRVVDAFTPEDLAPYDGVIFAAPAVTANSFRDGTPRPRVLARFGVGYDTVDLDGCTAHDVAVTITPDGARRPVATAALTMLLAVLGNVAVKDRLVRERRWAERDQHMGLGLSGITVGLIGVGNTGSDLVGLLAPFGVRVLGHDPFCPPERARALHVELVSREELAAQSDAVVVMAALTPATRHLVDDAFLATMRSTAVLINVARGPIVDEIALVDALRAGRIRAAGLDVFATEPPTSGIELLPNVTLAPHALAWTSEMSRGNGGSCVQAILDVAEGRVPAHVVNRDVLERPGFQARLAAALP
ncbi:MAG: NAD(P)-dependent oxidoreductase, partial [Propioniciclava sp.]